MKKYAVQGSLVHGNPIVCAGAVAHGLFSNAASLTDVHVPEQDGSGNNLSVEADFSPAHYLFVSKSVRHPRIFVKSPFPSLHLNS